MLDAIKCDLCAQAEGAWAPCCCQCLIQVQILACCYFDCSEGQLEDSLRASAHVACVGEQEQQLEAKGDRSRGGPSGVEGTGPSWHPPFIPLIGCLQPLCHRACPKGLHRHACCTIRCAHLTCIACISPVAQLKHAPVSKQIAVTA